MLDGDKGIVSPRSILKQVIVDCCILDRLGVQLEYSIILCTVTHLESIEPIINLISFILKSAFH